MTELAQEPDSSLIYDLYTGGFKPQLIRIALSVDVFSPLAAQPADTATVAHLCGCDPLGMRYLLDYLTDIGLLTSQDGHYGLTATAATFLLPTQKSYVGDLILAFTGTDMWVSLLRTLRSGETAVLEPEKLHVQDAWLESYSAWRIKSSLELWQAAGIRPNAHSLLSILDLACGCAIKSLSLAQRSPTVQVTCLDRSTVLKVTRDLAARMNVLGQVQFRPADLLTANLGEAQYQVCLLGQITHYLSEAQNCALFQRVYTALQPGGTLVLDVPMSTGTPQESSSFVSLFLWASGGGAAHSFESYRQWLKEAGFREVKALGERWTSAVK
ncbi:MAG: methyltransferase domain-containing protein [Anaerolineae bacterium]|nr:methyltransferase domain-containing protein [Anaerolineae bacterium]